MRQYAIKEISKGQIRKKSVGRGGGARNLLNDGDCLSEK